MPKLEKKLVRTGKIHVDHSATQKATKEASDSWSLPVITICCWQTHLDHTKLQEYGHGTTQMDNITARSTTSWLESVSVPALTSCGREASLELTLEVTMIW